MFSQTNVALAWIFNALISISSPDMRSRYPFAHSLLHFSDNINYIVHSNDRAVAILYRGDHHHHHPPPHRHYLWALSRVDIPGVTFADLRAFFTKWQPNDDDDDNDNDQYGFVDGYQDSWVENLLIMMRKLSKSIFNIFLSLQKLLFRGPQTL